MCRYGAGTCPYGVSCSYAHSAVVFRAELNSLRRLHESRSARRRSSGRSSPTSRRASRPTSSAGSSGSAPSATAAASRRSSSRCSSSRSCASRARSRPRPRRCWRRRPRRRRGACRRRRRTPTCCPRWRCRRARCRDRRRTPRGRRTPRCRGRRAGTACPSLYLEATAPRRHRTRRSRGHRGRRILGTGLKVTRRRGRRDTRTARRRRSRGRRTSRARRRGLLSESLPAKFWIRMLFSHGPLESSRRLYIRFRLWLGSTCFAAAARPSAARAPTSPERVAATTSRNNGFRGRETLCNVWEIRKLAVRH